MGTRIPPRISYLDSFIHTSASQKISHNFNSPLCTSQEQCFCNVNQSFHLSARVEEAHTRERKSPKAQRWTLSTCCVPSIFDVNICVILRDKLNNVRQARSAETNIFYKLTTAMVRSQVNGQSAFAERELMYTKFMLWIVLLVLFGQQLKNFLLGCTGRPSLHEVYVATSSGIVEHGISRRIFSLCVGKMLAKSGRPLSGWTGSK